MTTASGFEPVYSRGRNLIAFASNPASVALSAIRPDGGDSFPIDEQFWQNWEPTWSPTGERLAFTSSRLNRDWEIWTMPFGRPNEAVPLTDDPVARSWSPSWSPNGKYLAFFSDRDSPKDQVDIWP